MGKRSDFSRNPKDFYSTPYEGVVPLLPYLNAAEFIEPCAGDGRLIRHLEAHGMKCVYACDIDPLAPGIENKDVLFLGNKLPPAPAIITNPPWSRPSLHAMIDVFRNHAPSWLLFDADWMFSKQAKPYLKFCSRIVSAGRISWMDNSNSKTKYF